MRMNMHKPGSGFSRGTQLSTRVSASSPIPNWCADVASKATSQDRFHAVRGAEGTAQRP